MAWYIVDPDGQNEGRGHADCKIQCGEFESEASAESFLREPENQYDELGVVVELVFVLEYGQYDDTHTVGVFGTDRAARERIVADALAGTEIEGATITAHEVRS